MDMLQNVKIWSLKIKIKIGRYKIAKVQLFLSMLFLEFVIWIFLFPVLNAKIKATCGTIIRLFSHGSLVVRKYLNMYTYDRNA